MRQFTSDFFPCATGSEKVLIPFQGGGKKSIVKMATHQRQTDEGS